MTTTTIALETPATKPAKPAKLKKKTIKRKLVGGATPEQFYFNAGTQDAIMEFKAETDKLKRDKIYVQRILPAFEKLAENLINVYRFQVAYSTKGELQSACVNFLYDTIPKFDAARGSRAFGYFNVIAKHWLIVECKKSAKQQRVLCYIDDHDGLSTSESDQIENYKSVLSPEDQCINHESKLKAGMIMTELGGSLQTEDERKFFEHIKSILASAEDLDFHNKRAVMAYLREMTHAQPKKLSTMLSNMKRYYKVAKKNVEVQLYE
jgi:hypothetical protein